MFGERKTPIRRNPTPCTLTVDELPDVCDDILISTDEYKELLRKEIALDLICNIVNDQDIREEFKYSWGQLLAAFLRNVNPNKFIPNVPEIAPEKDGDPF